MKIFIPLILILSTNAFGRPPASPSDFKCTLSYSEFSKSQELKEIWSRPLPYNSENQSYRLNLRTPLANLPELNIEVMPYSLWGLADIGLVVTVNHLDIDGNLTASKDGEGSKSQCQFKMTWNEFPENVPGIVSRWLALNCASPREFCSY